jgi:hypothetical protein
MTNSVNAVVKYPCKEVNTKFGRKLNVVFETQNGELITKWGNPEDDDLMLYKKNQKVSLTKTANNKIIVMPLGENVEQVAQKVIRQERQNENVKDLLLKKAKDLAVHYNNCDKLVRENITDYKTEDSIRAITTTVFLQSVRSIAGGR